MSEENLGRAVFYIGINTENFDLSMNAAKNKALIGARRIEDIFSNMENAINFDKIGQNASKVFEVGLAKSAKVAASATEIATSAVKTFAGELGSLASAATGSLTAGFSGLKSLLISVASAGFGTLKDAAGAVVNALVTVGQRAGGLASGAVGALKEAALALGHGLEQVGEAAGGNLLSGLKSLADVAVRATSAAANLAAHVGGSLLSGLSSLGQAAASTVTHLTKLATTAGSLAVSAFSSLAHGAVSLASEIAQLATKAGNLTVNAFSGLVDVAGKAVHGLKILAEATVDTAGALVNLAGKAGHAAGEVGKLGAEAAIKTAEGLGHIAMGAAGLVADLAKLGLAAAATGSAMGTAFGVKAVGVFAEFEAALNQIKAVSNLTDEQLKQLTDRAIDLGAKFPISSTDAANGFGELAKAGFTANEVLAASNGLVYLGIAGQMNLAQSAELLAGAIRGFGLAATDATHVTDLFATVANASSVDLTDLGYSFKYIASAARASGYTIEEMSVALGLLGNNMIKGESAGVVMRTLIGSFASPSKAAAAAFAQLGVATKDAQGNMLPFTEVLKSLRAKFAGLSEAQQVQLAKSIAGQEAMGGFLALIKTSDADFAAMENAVKNSAGAAEQMASTMSGGVKGAINNLSGSVEGLQIRLGQALAPAVVLVANKLAELINKAAPFAEVIGTRIANQVIALVNGFEQLAPTLAGASSKFGPLIGKLLELHSLFSPLNLAVTALQGYLTGGLSGALLAIEGKVVEVGKAFGIDLTGAFKLANSFIGGTVLPMLRTVANFVVNDLIPAALQLASRVQGTFQHAFGQAAGIVREIFYGVILPAVEFVLGTLVPRLVQFANSVKSQFIGALQTAGRIASEVFFNLVLPAFQVLVTRVIPTILAFVNQFKGQFIQILQTAGQIAESVLYNVVLPAFAFAANLLTTVVLPALANVASMLEGRLIQAFQITSGVLQNIVIPAVQFFVAWSAANLLPILYSIANTIDQTVAPALTRFGGFFVSDILPLLGQFAGFIAATIVPTLGNIAAFTLTTVVPALTRLVELFSIAFGPAIQVVSDIFNNQLLPALTRAWQSFDSNLTPKTRELAAVFGQQLAQYIQLAAIRAQEMIPVVAGLWQQFGPVVLKVLELANAFSPLSIALSVFKGFLEGGLPGALAAFQGRIQNIGNILGIDLVGAIQSVANFFQTTLMPAVQAVIGWIVSDGIPTLQEMFKWFSVHIGPVLQSLATTFMNVVLPALSRFWDFAVKNVVPILERLANFIATTLIPVVGEIAAFIFDTVAPAFVKIVSVVLTALMPALETLGKVIVENILPTLKKIWEFTDQFIIPILTGLADMVGKVLSGQFQFFGGIVGGIWGTVEAVLKTGSLIAIGVFENMGRAVEWLGGVFGGIGTAVSNAFKFVGDILFGAWNYVVEVFNGIGRTIGWVIGVFQGIGTALANIWLGVQTGIGNFGNFVKGIFQNVLNFIIDILNAPINVINALIRAVKSSPIGFAVGWVPEIGNIPKVQFFEKGGTSLGGPTVVGEKDPEIVQMPDGSAWLASMPTFLPDLPKGAQVFKGSDTRAMLNNSRDFLAGLGSGNAGMSGAGFRPGDMVGSTTNNNSRQTIIERNIEQNLNITLSEPDAREVIEAFGVAETYAE